MVHSSFRRQFKPYIQESPSAPFFNFCFIEGESCELNVPHFIPWKTDLLGSGEYNECPHPCTHRAFSFCNKRRVGQNPKLLTISPKQKTIIRNNK